MPIRLKRLHSESEIERGIDAGEQLRRKGMARAACKNAAQINRGMRAMLRAMLSRDDLTGSADDIAPRLDEKYRDGGRWVGSVIQQLSRLRLIEFVGHVRSARPSRHGGWTGQYRLVDRREALQFIHSLEQTEIDSDRPDCPLSHGVHPCQSI